MSDEPVYEMFWDCAYCGSTELLGLTHRHCPNCGAPQDPAKRYFPPEDRKVAVADHRYVGADKHCGACGTAASASAAHCPGCGAPLEGEADVARVADAAPGAAAPTPGPVPAGAPSPPRKKKGGIVGKLVLLALLALVAFGIYALVAKKESPAVVTGHAWRRSVTVQRYEEARDQAWCDSLPSGARVTGREQKQRDTRRIPDGETCTTRNVDQGDGTFRQVQDCQPRYREEPIMAPWCTYLAPRWVDQRPVVAEGRALEPAPSWPKAQVTGCARLGCTREGPRSETYTLQLDLGDDGAATCDVPESRWRAAPVGSRWIVEVGTVTGRLDCDDIHPAN